jgi:hypothetical protein
MRAERQNKAGDILKTTCGNRSEDSRFCFESMARPIKSNHMTNVIVKIKVLFDLAKLCGQEIVRLQILNMLGCQIH